MAVNAPDDIEKMLTSQQGKMQALGASLNGAGAEALVAYKALTSHAASMVATGRDAAQAITASRADESTPRPFRLGRENETRDSAQVMLRKFNEGAHAAAGHLEAALTTALLPAPSKDASTRLLIRDELRTRFRNTDSEKLMSAIASRLGASEADDGELLSGFGASYLEGAGLTPDQVDGLRHQAVAAYLKRDGGSRQQQAARTALRAFSELNIRGAIAAYQQAGRMHLSKAD